MRRADTDPKNVTRPKRVDDAATIARGGAPMMELLETREMMSVSTDAAGFTVVTPAADSRVVYVSSSGGTDANSGLSAGAPVKSLLKGMSLVRDGSADQLLLKRGDTWHESFGRWTKDGRSADEPLVIGAYGNGDRPLIATGTQTGLSTGSARDHNVSHLAILGLNFWADGRDPSTHGYDKTAPSFGLQMIAGGGDLRVEDCKIEGYENNIDVSAFLGPVSDVTIRRCVVADAYSGTSDHSQGLFVDGVHNLLLDQNVFDHNGWNARVPGAVPTMYNHDAYLTGSTDGVVVTGNVFANAGSHGLQARSGGVITNNLFVDNPIGMSYGLVNGLGHPHAGGVYGQVTGNVFLGGRDIDGVGRGIGIEVANTKVGGHTVISDNLFARYPQGAFAAISLEYCVGTYASDQVGLNDLTIRNNVVYKWATGLSVVPGMSTTAGGAQAMRGVVLQGNDFSMTDQPIYNAAALGVNAAQSVGAAASSATAFPAANRSLGLYDAATGGDGTAASFLDSARDQSRQTWQRQYTAKAATDYLRGGFGLAPAGDTTPTRVSPSPTAPAPSPTPVAPASPTASPTASPEATPTPTAPSESRGAAARKRAPVVRRVKFHHARHGAIGLSIQFSRDVGATLQASDLVLTAPDGQRVDPSSMTLDYDALTRTGHWSFSGASGNGMTAGKYKVQLASAGIADAAGRHLDGDRDHVAGGDFETRRRLKVHTVRRAA